MKNIVFLFFFLTSSVFCHAQFFQATINTDGNDLVFLLRANPGGGDITTQWIDTEFFVRWPNGSPAFNFGTITVNNTDFPGVSIPNNGQDAQGVEEGFTNNWFGTSFSATPSANYSEGVEYEIFRVTLDIPASSINFELVHNDGYYPHYLALISQIGSDLSNVAGNMFYSDNAMICSPNCPVSTPGSNHVDAGLSPPLPVELFSFTAKKLENDVKLDWITASEENNSGFSIERKTAQEEWTEIGFVEGNGTTSEFSTYDFLDTNPASGNNYYRLKQIDFDGAFEYSDIQVINFNRNKNELSVYPNPTSDVVNVKLNETINNGDLQIFDQLGRLILQDKIYKEETLKTIPVHQFPEGIYTIKIFSGNQIFTEKFIVQRSN